MRISRFLMLSIGLIVIAVCLCGCTANNSGNTPPQSTATSTQPSTSTDLTAPSSYLQQTQEPTTIPITLTTTTPSSANLNITINGYTTKVSASDLNSIAKSGNLFPALPNGYDYLLLNATIQNTGNNDFSATIKSFKIIGDSIQATWHPSILTVFSTTGVVLGTSDKIEDIPAKSSLTGVYYFSILANAKTCKFSVVDSYGNAVTEIDNIPIDTAIYTPKNNNS